jgi:hypothetical protein
MANAQVVAMVLIIVCFAVGVGNVEGFIISEIMVRRRHSATATALATRHCARHSGVAVGLACSLACSLVCPLQHLRWLPVHAKDTLMT